MAGTMIIKMNKRINRISLGTPQSFAKNSNLKENTSQFVMDTEVFMFSLTT